MSYLWTGSLNGVKLQIWEGYFMLMIVDLGDAVADELYVPFDQIFLEMIYRGLYHFSVACQKGIKTDPVTAVFSNMRYSLAWGMGQTGHGAWDCPVYLINLQSAVSILPRPRTKI